MITLDGNQSTAANATARGLALLVEMEFTSGTERLTTYPLNVTHSGSTFYAAGGRMEVSQIKESPAASGERVSIAFTVANQALLAKVIGNVEYYRGRPVTIYVQLFNADGTTAGAAIKRWAGYMDKVSVRRKSGGLAGKNGGVVEMQCYRAGMAKARTPEAGRLSHAEQQRLFPGDKGLEYVQTLVEKQFPWLTKAFQEQR